MSNGGTVKKKGAASPKKTSCAGWKPRKAMVLAAGFGTRLRPITEKTPKPLVMVGGRTLLDRAIDRLEQAGVKTVVVNLHYLGHLIEQHLRKRKSPEILFTHEEEILETGGGIANALDLLGDEPFYVANTDIMWLNGPQCTLGRMAQAWDDVRMDALLLLHFTVDAYGYKGNGDFSVDPDGRIRRRPEREISPYLNTGVQILHPRLFKDMPVEPFSLNVLYDRAICDGRLFGIVHDGEWFHIGTQEGLAEADAYVRIRYAGIKHR